MLSRFSCVQLLATLWTTVRQAPLSMGISRQGYWSGLPCPPPRDLSHPGIKLTSLASPALADGCFSTALSWKLLITYNPSKQHPLFSSLYHTNSLQKISNACSGSWERHNFKVQEFGEIGIIHS